MAGTKEIGFEQDRKIKFGKIQIQNKFSELSSEKFKYKINSVN